jgi:prepilin-type N-terminal cleavage/methylation domain-containing protein/prepilin-type processing-associated H-X9-DG protein
MKRRKTIRGGFNLIELLVVIASIALLAAMLLPAYSKAKAKSQGICCMDNMKQLRLGWLMYSSDNMDRLVPNAGLDALVTSYLDPGIDPWNAKNSWVYGSMSVSPAATDSRLIQAGLLYPYVKSLAVYKCPADPKQEMDSRNQMVPTARSVSMNVWLNPTRSWNEVMGYTEARALRVFRKQSDITRFNPALCWVFIDENPFSINDGSFTCDPNDFSQWQDIPATYHNGAGGLAFADGHSEIKKWKDNAILTVAANSTGRMKPAPGVSDLQWLQERSTSLQYRTLIER